MKTLTITTLSIITIVLFSGCVNKHGISAKYYSDCEEYYDMQGYYHKECGKDDIVTYEKMGDAFKEKKDLSKTKNVY
jgi:hypothetical protein